MRLDPIRSRRNQRMTTVNAKHGLLGSDASGAPDFAPGRIHVSWPHCHHDRASSHHSPRRFGVRRGVGSRFNAAKQSDQQRSISQGCVAPGQSAAMPVYASQQGHLLATWRPRITWKISLDYLSHCRSILRNIEQRETYFSGLFATGARASRWLNARPQCGGCSAHSTSVA
jgi:hypothetical protein